MAGKPDPKPVSEGGIGRKKPDRGNRRRGRKMATRDQWAELRRAKLTECRICKLDSELRGPDPLYFAFKGRIELHHLVPRSLGGDDVDDNLVSLCASHHYHVTRRSEPSLILLADQLTDAEYAYIIGKLGEGGPERLFGVSR